MTEPIARAAKPKPLTWYHASLGPEAPRPRLEGMLRARVCVIGGGLCGVATALELAERGIDTVLLEAETIGHGASGRNGGQIVQGFSASIDTLMRAVDAEEALTVWNLGREAIDLIEERVRRHKIDCDLRWGYFHAAVTQRQLHDLQATARAYADLGYNHCQVIDGTRMRAEVLATDRYVGGMLDPESGQLHPLAYLRGLVGVAEFLDVRLFERSAVTVIDPGADGVTVRTATGAVEADHVVFAGNAYLGRLIPSLRRRLMPVASFIGVTEPIAADVARSLFKQDVAVADGNLALDYFRLTADNRLLFGAGASYSAIPPLGLSRWLAKRIRRVFPELGGIRIDHAWGGLIGITVNRLPDLGRIGDRILYAQGFSGQGVALTGIAGRLIAEAVDGDDSRFALLAQIRHRAFPGGPLRTPALVAVTALAKVKDRLGF